MSLKLTLERGQRYALTMYPGYGWGPYHSPITVLEVTGCGGSRRELALTFINHAYASGVQEMGYDLRILKRETDYLIGEVMGTDRTVVIVPLAQGGSVDTRLAN